MSYFLIAMTKHLTETTLGETLLWLTVSGDTVHHAGKTHQQEPEVPGRLSAVRKQIRQELKPDYKTSRPAPSNPWPPVKIP